MKKRHRKVVIVGLDGATFDVIGPWIDEGKLVNMAKMVEKGVSGYLTSVFPPLTPPAWASFMTGKNPGKHGVMDFDLREKGSYRRIVADASKIDGETLWASLSRAGKRVGVVHVPLTHPPERVNGFMVSGYTMSSSISTYPPSLAKEILSKVQGYERIYSDVLLVAYTSGMEDTYLKRVYYATEKEEELTFYLMDNYQWDFFMTHFYWGDQLQHRLWKYMDPSHPLYDPGGSKKYGDAIFRYYQRIDDIIGEIQKKIDANTILIVMSDHGFGPLHKRVYINHWLLDLGLLKLKQSKTPVYSNWISRLGLSREELFGLVEKHNLLKSLLKKVPRSLARILYWSAPLARPTLEDIDFRRTQAYSAGHVGQIFINLEERDPEGVVPRKNYEELIKHITNELCELRDPSSGEKIVDNIFRKEEIYKGPYVDLAADLLFIMRNMTYITQSSIGSGTPWEFGTDLTSLTGPPGTLTAWHRMNGIFMASGRDIKEGAMIENARMIDLAPTVLHIFDAPIPSDVDGRILKEIFEPESCFAKNEVRYRALKMPEREKYILTEREEEQIKKKLKALGYMD